MGVRRYTYYFRKPHSEIAKDVLSWLFIGGAVALAATSPYFIQNLLSANRRFKKYPKRTISTTFDRLRREGVIAIDLSNNQIYISLTAEGKKKAGIFQINDFKIKKPKQWDGKWRLLTFDIAHKRRLLREALRGKLKQLGFRQFQKSIWIHAFDCRDEIELLKEFFGLTDKEVQLVVAEDIGNTNEWKRIFRLSS